MMKQELTQLDPKLLAVMTLQQNGGPEPGTIAAQVMGRAQQGIANMAQPQQMAPQGLPDILANVQQATPSVQQNAQEQQVGQMAQQVAQHMQKQQQPAGVTGLPAGNMGFAESGIVPVEEYAKGGAVAPVMASTEYGAGFTPGVGIMGGMVTPSAAPSNSQIESMLVHQTEIARLNKERPNFLAQQIATLDADKQARMEAASTQKDRQGYEALMAMFGGAARSGMSGMGEATTAFNRGLDAQKNAAREASLLDAQMRIKLGELDYARKIGDVTGYIAIDKDIAGIQNKLDELNVQREGQGVQRRGQDMTSATAREQNVSQERIAANRDRATLSAAEMGQSRADERQNRVDFKTQLGVLKIGDKIKALGDKQYNPRYAQDYKAVMEQVDDLAKFYNIPSNLARIMASESFGVAGAGAPAAGATAAGGATGSWGQMSVK